MATSRSVNAMGCSFSLHRKVMDSSPKLGQNNIEFLESAQTLVKHFDEIKPSQKNKKLVKCIFIFGRSGSCKGEFIWDLMRKHAREEEELNQMNLRRFVLPAEDDSKELPEEAERRKRFKFSYIDIEKLVSMNIKKRISELVKEGNSERGHRLYVPQEVDGESSSSSCDQCESPDNLSLQEEYDEDMKIEKVKPYLTEFANVVTCNWILRLVESEIKKRLKQSITQKRSSSSCSSSSHHSASGRFRRFSHHQVTSSSSEEPETIFLVNLLPNRINLFKKCLYLNQTPNLNHAQFDYFAINLTRVESDKKKDLDVVSSGTSFLDETNNTFVKYFRSLNKLVEFRIRDDKYTLEDRAEFTIILTGKATDKRITDIQKDNQLRTLLKENLPSLKKGCVGLKSCVTINVKEYRREKEDNILDGKNSCDRRAKSPPSPLIFMVGNRIELEHNVTVLLDESFQDTSLIRPFINSLRQILCELHDTTTKQ